MSESTDFEKIQQQLDENGAAAALDVLAEKLREQQKYHELFEALKMLVRLRIGLPLLYNDSGDELEPDQRDQLETGLLDACREVGMLLLKAGKIREGWMYLRPVGDVKSASEVLRQVEPSEDNLDELVEVSLSEGVDIQLGYGLVLEHFGTCNAITTFESEIRRRSRPEQQVAAEMLVQHVHDELMENVKADIARHEGNEPSGTTLSELLDDRESLFSEHAYHIDTTHLASTVRAARVLDNPQRLHQALDLTRYGCRLSDQFQYDGDPPFQDLYPSHALYFEALLGQNVDEAIQYFRNRAEQLDVHEFGTIGVEVYVDLLSRIGRYQEAIDETVRLMPEGMPSLNLAPSLLELSQRAQSFDALMDVCRKRDDLLGFYGRTGSRGARWTASFFDFKLTG